MNVKARRTKKQVNVENQAINLLSKEELNKKIEVVEKELRSYTWRELETNGKFAKNDTSAHSTSWRNWGQAQITKGFVHCPRDCYLSAHSISSFTPQRRYLIHAIP